MLRTRIVPAGLLAGLAMSCTTARPSVDTAATQRVLDSVLVVHAQLFKDKNVDALLEAYTDSPVVYANHTEPVRGRGALRPLLTTFVHGGEHGGELRSLTYHTEELAVYGDSAWQILTYQASIQLPGTDVAVSDHGGGFALWVRDSTGRWRIHRDIFNSSVPLPSPNP